MGELDVARGRAGRELHDRDDHAQRAHGASARPDAGDPAAGGLGRVARSGESGRSRAARALPVDRDGRGASVDEGEQREDR